MKKLILIPLIVFFCFSCASIHDIEKKKAEGDATIETFNYPWEAVFDAMKFVIKHSKNKWLNLGTRAAVIDYTKEEKSIIINYVNVGTIDMGIFFESLDSSKTKVYFVEGGWIESGRRKTRIKAMIEETQYILVNGENAYRKYTHEKEEKRKTE